MPKLKLPDIEKVVAIDIHTHAEEPCGMHGDDGYDDFQERMADYFKSPHKHPPTVPETAAYYRSKNIAAVIFPVDAERETGFRRYNNYEMLEVASDHLDVLIPFVSIDPSTKAARSRCFTPARPASAPACPAAWACA